MPQSSRRDFLRAGTLGVGASVGAATVAGLPGIALATDGRTTDPADPRFTLAVIPDTQYLFDADRGDSEPLEASLKYLVQARASENIVFAAHLGDVVENAAAPELAEAGRVMRILDRHRLPYSVLAGNHDINSRTDDTRGHSSYLDVFGPSRYQSMHTFGGFTSGGYNTYHRLRAGSVAAGLSALSLLGSGLLAASPAHTSTLGRVGTNCTAWISGNWGHGGAPDCPVPAAGRWGLTWCVTTHPTST